MEWMLLPLKRYADFNGRSRRKEYWMFILGQIIVFAILALLFFLTVPSGGMTDAANGVPAARGLSFLVFGVGLLFVLAIFIPTLALQVRRFHDQDKSGWLVLLQFIPYAGGIIMLVFMCIEGTKGSNRFGSDPVVENLGDTFA